MVSEENALQEKVRIKVRTFKYLLPATKMYRLTKLDKKDSCKSLTNFKSIVYRLPFKNVKMYNYFYLNISIIDEYRASKVTEDTLKLDKN